MGSHGELATARNAAFSTLVFAELLRSFGARSETKLVHEVGLFSNLRLFAVVAVSFGLQLWIHHAPALERLFGIQPISLRQCLAWIAIGSRSADRCSRSASGCSELAPAPRARVRHAGRTT